MSLLELRRATQKDSKFLTKLEGTSQSNWLRKELKRQDISMFIAFDTKLSQPVGWAQIDHDGCVDELRWAVAPWCRKQGFGRKIAEKLVTLTINPIVIATIKNTNFASEKLAKSIGMEPVGEDYRGYVVWRKNGKQ